LVTFDDGYRDNREMALPILMRHGVRATFFIATRYVTERRMFWWDRINYILRRSDRKAIAVDYPKRIALSLEGGPEAAARTVLRIVKDTYGLDLDRLLDELAAGAGVEWSRDLETRLANELLMTWDDIRALRQSGQDVQSHTRSHRVLQTLPADEL